MISPVATAYNVMILSTVEIVISLDTMLFIEVIEGNSTTVCASFNNTFLDRGVPIFFQIQELSATGTYVYLCMCVAVYSGPPLI